MALRLGDPPGLVRLRLKWQATRNHLYRQTRTICDETHQWWERSCNVLHRWSLPERARQRQRAQNLIQLETFCARYEDLVDLLCWAAREGADARQIAQYRELREWMLVHYGLLRPRLRPFLHNADNAYDPFECLFTPQELGEVINDASAIDSMMETLEVLKTYRASLS